MTHTQILKALNKLAINKTELKDCLKESIENWKSGNMNVNETYLIKYADATEILFTWDYKEKKPSLQNITNIFLQSEWCSMDFYFDDIVAEDDVENQVETMTYTNRLIVDSMDTYYKNFSNDQMYEDLKATA